MSVHIRLARHGMKKRPFYRIVAADKNFRRDGRFLEVVGTYDPKADPPAVTMKDEKVKKWIANGAKPSKLARDIINKQIPGLITDKEQAQRAKIQERRRKRKARAKARPAAAPKKTKQVTAKKAKRAAAVKTKAKKEK